MVCIHYGQVDVSDLVVGGQGQQYELDDRHSQYQHHDRPVAEYLPELFAEQESECSHARRVLKLLRLMRRSASVMPLRIRVCFQMVEKPSPLIMIDFTML